MKQSKFKKYQKGELSILVLVFIVLVVIVGYVQFASDEQKDLVTKEAVLACETLRERGVTTEKCSQIFLQLKNTPKAEGSTQGWTK